MSNLGTVAALGAVLFLAACGGDPVAPENGQTGARTARLSSWTRQLRDPYGTARLGGLTSCSWQNAERRSDCHARSRYGHDGDVRRAFRGATILSSSRRTTSRCLRFVGSASKRETPALAGVEGAYALALLLTAARCSRYSAASWALLAARKIARVSCSSTLSQDER